MTLPRVRRMHTAAIGLALMLLSAIAVRTRADAQWQADIKVDHSPGTDTVLLGADAENSRLHAVHSDMQPGGTFSWMRSTNSGFTWETVREVSWGAQPSSLAFDVLQGRLVTAWTAGEGPMSGEVMDWDSGAVLEFFDVADESPRIVRKLLLVSCGANTVLAAAVMIDPRVDQVRVRAYRSSTGGASWLEGVTIDTGPLFEPDHIRDIALTTPADGCPTFHIAFVREGQACIATTTDGGVSWGAPQALTLSLDPESSIGVAGRGTEVVVVGESQTGQIVSLYSADGTAWSSGLLIDSPETTGRFPAISCRGETYHVFYLKADHRIAHRSTTTPGQVNGWGAEQVATSGSTDAAFAALGMGASAGVGFVHRNDSGNPYFASSTYTPSGLTDPAGEAGGLRVFPQPATGSVSIVGPFSRRGGPSGVVVDATGRVIARLSDPRTGPRGPVGTGTLHWDGHDMTGTEVAAGVYYVRVQVPDTAARRTLTAPIAIVR